MTHLIPISGGKDSQATAIWFAQNQLAGATERGEAVQLVFCDTGNEAALTYEFIEKMLVPALPKGMQNLIVLKNRRGETLLEQAARKGRFPSNTRRFCTVELKVEPMIDHILSFQEDVTIWDGRRRQESPSRSTLERDGDYFEGYIDFPEKKAAAKAAGKKVKSPYRYRAVREWTAKHEARAVRPILMFSALEVFTFIATQGYKRNPLYDKGFNRVGCFPCVLCSLGEVIRVAEVEPEKIAQIRAVEVAHGTTFFGPDKIPVRFYEKQIVNDEGRLVGAPTIDEVLKYARDKRHDAGLFQGTCQNPYVACE